MKVQASSIELLEVMLEETNEKSPDLACSIAENLDVKILLQAMMQLNLKVKILHYFIEIENLRVLHW